MVLSLERIRGRFTASSLKLRNISLIENEALVTRCSLKKLMLAVLHQGTSFFAILTKPCDGCYLMLSTLLSVMLLQGNTLIFFFFLF